MMDPFKSLMSNLMEWSVNCMLGQYLDIKIDKNSLNPCNVRIKADVINEEFLKCSPYLLHEGTIGSLKFNIPWTAIASKPLDITVDQVRIVLKYNRN